MKPSIFTYEPKFSNKSNLITLIMRVAESLPVQFLPVDDFQECN